MNAARSIDAYREQIHHYAQQMALGRSDGVAAGLVRGMPVELVDMFTEGNLAKRFDKLTDACELLADDFENLDELIKAYIHEVPLAAYDTNCTDCERFLVWIGEREDLSPEQEDFIRCQRSRHAVEFVAVKKRLAFVRFQELLSMNDRLIEELGKNVKLSVHLNPVHVWSRFETRALLDDDATVPATVLFFPVGDDVRTAVIEPDAERMIRLLDRSGVMYVRDIRKLYPRNEREQVVDLIRDLAEMGIVALG